jgi:hypothetical protein
MPPKGRPVAVGPAESLTGLGGPAQAEAAHSPAPAVTDTDQIQLPRSLAELRTLFDQFSKADRDAAAAAPATLDDPSPAAPDTPVAPHVHSITREINKVAMPTGSSVVPWNTELSIDRNIHQACSIFGAHYEHARAVATTVCHLHFLGGGLSTHTAGWLELNRFALASIRASQAGKPRSVRPFLYSHVYVCLANEKHPCSADWAADDFNSTASWGRVLAAKHKELYDCDKIAKYTIDERDSTHPKFDSSSYSSLADRNGVSKALSLNLFNKLVQSFEDTGATPLNCTKDIRNFFAMAVQTLPTACSRS